MYSYPLDIGFSHFKNTGCLPLNIYKKENGSLRSEALALSGHLANCQPHPISPGQKSADLNPIGFLFSYIGLLTFLYVFGVTL